jgi:signal transduction histidine kinase
MQINRLFSRTRWRLAFSYAIAMALILGAMGIFWYATTQHILMFSAAKELDSFVGVMHDEIEVNLSKPGEVSKDVMNFLPQMCLTSQNCPENKQQFHRYLKSILVNEYHLQLFDTRGKLVAATGDKLPSKLNIVPPDRQLIISDQADHSYIQKTMLLHDKKQRDWGYLQVSRDLQDVAYNLKEVRWLLTVGLPIAWVVILIASWLLAGSAMKPIYRSYQHIQQFTADAAHELRTPLAATQATVESALLQPGAEWPQVQDVLTIIQRQNQRLIQLVSDLLLLSRIDLRAYGGRSTGFRQEWEACCLNNIVADLDEELAAMAMAADIHFSTIMSVDHALWVWGNSEQLYRLVTNLIVNAIKYTPAKGQVTVFLRQRNRMAIIQVQDTGMGIEAKAQKRIFDRFYRVYNNRSRHDGGSGLGLAIVKSIATLHRGRLSVQSKVGHGSIFTLELPKLGTRLKKPRFQ